MGFFLIDLWHNDTLNASPLLKQWSSENLINMSFLNRIKHETCIRSVLYWGKWWSGKFMFVRTESRLEIWVTHWVLLKRIEVWVPMSFEGLICMYLRYRDSSMLDWGHSQTWTDLVTGEYTYTLLHPPKRNLLYFRFFIPCIFYMCYNKNYQQMRLFVLCLYFLFLVTCFGPSWAHHQGYFKLLFLCYHLVHAVLCWSSACASGLVCGGDFGVLVP